MTPRRNRSVVQGEGWIAVRSLPGAPNMVMLIEELFAFGVRKAVCIGYCGSLQKDVAIGDVVIPMEAVREEGTSYHYLRASEKSIPDAQLQRILRDCIERANLRVHEGKVWTTDAPYRETPDKVMQYRKEGVVAVEMEMSAAFAVSLVRGISIGAILLVSDELRETEWRPGFISQSLRRTRGKIFEKLLGCLPELMSPSPVSNRADWGVTLP